MKRFILSILTAAVFFSFTACASFEGDRKYISDVQYEMARKIYNETGSLQITESKLLKEHWHPGEVNEAIYRLSKQYHIATPGK